jgi:transcription initiation factor TFIID subunit 1
MGPGGTERTGRPVRENLSSLAYDAEYIEQLDLISNHTLVKADLSLSELRHYFRPLLPKKIFRSDKRDSSWQLQLQVKVFPNASLIERRGRKSGGNGSLVNSFVNSSLPGTLSQSQIRRGSDLTPTEGDLVLFEYCEERPPLQLTKGMASKIINYYRGDRSKCPISRGGGDRPVRRRKHGVQENGSKLDGVIEKVEKPPRLSGPESDIKNVTDLIGKIPTKKKHEDKYDKDSNLTVLPEGVTEILHAKEHGPFIGAVSENSTQSGIISNLFSAPIFRHEPKPTDFLMILGKLPAKNSDVVDSNSIPVVLRPMPKSLFTVGQTEPKQKVHAPESTNEKSFFGTFASFHIAKALQRKKERESGLTFEDIRESLFPNTDIKDPFLRSKLKGVALFDKNTGIYSLRDVGDGDYEGVDALGRKMSPEDVSAYLCSRLYLQRLQDLGICDIPLKGNTMIATAVAFLNGCVKTAESRYISMKKLSHSQRKSDKYDSFVAATQHLEEEWKNLQKKAELANYVYEELQLAPWQITTDFIDVHKKGTGSGMMKLTGLGDPSGIGNAFNLLRETDGKTGPRAAVAASNKDLEDRVKKITGTDNDLRKLNMTQMASILRSYGMQQKDIDVLRRWDRVHVIRDLSTKAASDNISDGLERFARGEKIRLSDQKKIYQERIQEIWNRQRASLMETGLDFESPRRSMIPDSIGDERGEKKNFDAVDGRDIGSDDDDEDGFEDEFDDAFKDTEKTNELVSNQIRSEIEDTEAFRAHVIQKPKGKFLDREAMALAALQREREEEHAMQMGMDTITQKELHRSSMAANKNRRVIKRKITKTHPDGTQKVSFEFIIQPTEVKKILMDKSAALDAKKNKKKINDDKLFFPPSHPVGHSVFEDENEGRIVVQKKTVRAHRGRKSFVDDDFSPARRKTSKGKGRGKTMTEKKPKRKRSEDEDLELFISTNRRKGTSNRKERGAARERMPHVLLADRLEQIRASCEMRPNSAAFHRPVDKAFNVYHERIKTPIDLSTIRETIFK